MRGARGRWDATGARDAYKRPPPGDCDSRSTRDSPRKGRPSRRNVNAWPRLKGIPHPGNVSLRPSPRLPWGYAAFRMPATFQTVPSQTSRTPPTLSLACTLLARPFVQRTPSEQMHTSRGIAYLFHRFVRPLADALLRGYWEYRSLEFS